MADRSDMAALETVSHIRRLKADLAASEASDADVAARKDAHKHRNAEQALGNAETAWSRYIARPGFDPAMSALLAAQLLENENQTADAKAQHRKSEIYAARAHEHWRVAEAEREVGELMLDDARRSEHRRRDERNLAKIEDIVTYRRAMS